MSSSLDALRLVVDVLQFEFADVSDHRTFGAARQTFLHHLLNLVLESVHSI